MHATFANLFTEYADLFKDKVGSLPVTYFMKIDPAVPPMVQPVRSIPVAIQTKESQVGFQRMTCICIDPG